MSNELYTVVAAGRAPANFAWPDRTAAEDRYNREEKAGNKPRLWILRGAEWEGEPGKSKFRIS